MPKYRKMLNSFIDRITFKPEWHRPLLENASGYRNRSEVVSDLEYVLPIEKTITYQRVKMESINDGLKVYSRAGRPKLGFLVLGRKYINGVARLMSTEETPVIDISMSNKFGILNEAEGKKGSILKSDKWTFYINDMFIAGGIANKKPFYLASSRTKSNLWEKDHPTIFARELAGLFGAGYELQVFQDGSEALFAPCESTKSLTLRSYLEVREQLLNSDEVAFMYKKNFKKFTFNATTKKFIPSFR